MDNSDDSSTVEWSTPRLAGFAMAIGGAILLVGAVMAPDPAGMVLLGIASLALLGFGAYALLVRPRLTLTHGTPPTLTARTIGGVHSYHPDQIERIRMRSFRRIGRRVGQLELDVLPEGAVSTPGQPHEDSRLLVFSRWDLGADLGDVALALRQGGFVVDDER